jgi:hypothetical protein
MTAGAICRSVMLEPRFGHVSQSERWLSQVGELLHSIAVTLTSTLPLRQNPSGQQPLSSRVPTGRAFQFKQGYWGFGRRIEVHTTWAISTERKLNGRVSERDMTSQYLKPQLLKHLHPTQAGTLRDRSSAWSGATTPANSPRLRISAAAFREMQNDKQIFVEHHARYSAEPVKPKPRYVYVERVNEDGQTVRVQQLLDGSVHEMYV